jgi:hypothetical protein
MCSLHAGLSNTLVKYMYSNIIIHSSYFVKWVTVMEIRLMSFLVTFPSLNVWLNVGRCLFIECTFDQFMFVEVVIMQ